MKRYGWPLLGIILLLIALFISLLIHTTQTLNLTGQVTAQTHVNIIEAIPANCDFTLYSGKNEVSFFCIVNGLDKDELLDSLDYNFVFKYDSTDSSDPWKVLNPDLPNYTVQDFDTFDRISGYVIDVDSNTNFFYAGSKRVPNDIIIRPGWNLVGFPTNISRTIPDILTTINGSYSQVHKFDNNAKTYSIHYAPNTGALTEANPYDAFWINGTTTDIWTVS